MVKRDKKMVAGVAQKRSDFAYQYSDRDENLWQIIRAGLSLPGTGAVERVVNVINNHELHHRLWKASLRHSIVRKKTKKAVELSTRLTKELNALDEDVLHHLSTENNVDSDKLISQLRRLVTPLPTDPGGASGDPTSAELIQDLAHIYMTETKKNPTISTNNYNEEKRGSFFGIVDAVSIIIGRPPESPEALAKFIQRSLGTA